MMSKPITRKMFHEAMDTSLSGLKNNPWLAGRIRAQLKETELDRKKKMSVGILIAFPCIIFSIVAIASGIIFSPKATSRNLADHELMNRYGLTYDMQSFFSTSTCYNEDGSITISYEGMDDLAFVLGRYDVRIKNNTVLDVSWSHDGEDVANGFESNAWGSNQLQEMLKLNKKTNDMRGFMPYVYKINANNGIPEIESITYNETNPDGYAEELHKIQSESKYSPAEMDEMAREAVIQLYQLNQKQAGMLLFGIVDDDLTSYIMKDDVPCHRRWLFLVQNPDPDNPYIPLNSVEKDGTYIVFINTITGTIEDIQYSTGAGGNG